MKVSQKIVCNIAEYCLQLRKGEGIDLYPILFSTMILGNFEYHAKLLGLPFEFEPDGFSEDDDCFLLVEAMQETVRRLDECLNT